PTQTSRRTRVLRRVDGISKITRHSRQLQSLIGFGEERGEAANYLIDFQGSKLAQRVAELLLWGVYIPGSNGLETLVSPRNGLRSVASKCFLSRPISSKFHANAAGCQLTGEMWSRKYERKGAGRQPPALPLPRAYTLALPFALFAYLRAAGDKEGEGHKLTYAEQQQSQRAAAAVLAGAVCAAVSVFCAGVVRDCADTLYCWDEGKWKRRERQQVWGAFDPSPSDLVSPPLDDEATAGLGLNFAGFDLTRFGFGLGGTGPAAAAEQGGRGEEPVYVLTAHKRGRESEEPGAVAYLYRSATAAQERGRDTVPPRASGRQQPSFERARVLAAACAAAPQPQLRVEIESDDTDSLDSSYIRSFPGP
ncbi:hypothetical protein C8R45DRAFT_1144949, partial [Mycena sanguinolenta]